VLRWKKNIRGRSGRNGYKEWHSGSGNSLGDRMKKWNIFTKLEKGWGKLERTNWNWPKKK
jgi:hypothetical protein